MFSFRFDQTCIIPKETFDLIAAKSKDLCGIRSEQERYVLACSNTSEADLNKLELIMKFKSISLKINFLFGKSYTGQIES